MNDSSNTPWQGDWQARLRDKLSVLGYADLDDFLKDNPGVGYVKLAASLRDANIAAMQLYGEQIRSAAATGNLRVAAQDCLVRFLNEYVKRGWGEGRHFANRSASAYAAWRTTIVAHSPPNIEIAEKLKAVFERLEAATPPPRWLPQDSTDHLIVKCFDEGWPTNEVT